MEGKTINKVLKFICSEKSDNINSLKCSEKTKINLSEVNEIFRYLIRKGEAINCSTLDDPPRSVSIIRTDITIDVYESQKYYKESRSHFKELAVKYWWTVIIPITIGLFLIFFEHWIF